MTAQNWDDLEREIVRTWTAGDVAHALRTIDIVLAEGSDEMRGRALLYRGSIHEDDGAWEIAKRDFIAQSACWLPGRTSGTRLN